MCISAVSFQKKPDDLQAVIDRPFFVDAKVFHPNCVAEPSLKEGDPEDEVDVEISLHADIAEEKLDEVRNKIAQAIDISTDIVEITDDGVSKIAIQRDKLRPLAAIDQVYAIDMY